jgi:hypothetical protein
VAPQRGTNVEQPISRRRILTLAGSGLAGATVVSESAAGADRGIDAQFAAERAYRPLRAGRLGRARIATTDQGGTSRARVEAFLERSAAIENRELAVLVRAAVADDLVGRRRVMRTIIVGDNGELRVETVGPEIRIDDPLFELEIVLGRGDPIRDWRLIRERIFAVRVTLNILETDDFAVSDDFLFKVRR